MTISWLKLLIFTLLIGITKAHHIKLLVLAVLGLAGLWMMQNFTQNQGDNKSFFSVANLASKFLTKRSITVDGGSKEIDWDLILSNDYSTCTRSFICQLSSMPEENLSGEEKRILNVIKQSSGSQNWSNKQLQIAMRNGEKLKSKVNCRKLYRKCPYCSSTMLTLLNLFNDQVTKPK